MIKADITNVFEGEGRLRIEDGGLIRAGVEASIIPVGLGVEAAIAFAKMGTELDPWIFLSLYMGVQFSTPLPLANSGLAIYGFKGLFTMNGSRDLESIGNPDPVLRELDWWAVPPESKYKPDRGQFALGVGVVVGTMPDASFCVELRGHDRDRVPGHRGDPGRRRRDHLGRPTRRRPTTAAGSPGRSPA